MKPTDVYDEYGFRKDGTPEIRTIHVNGRRKEVNLLHPIRDYEIMAYCWPRALSFHTTPSGMRAFKDRYYKEYPKVGKLEPLKELTIEQMVKRSFNLPKYGIIEHLIQKNDKWVIVKEFEEVDTDLPSAICLKCMHIIGKMCHYFDLPYELPHPLDELISCDFFNVAKEDSP